MLQFILSVFLHHWRAILLLLLTARLGSNYFNHGLNKYPGPLAASLSDLWRFFDVWGRRPDITHIKLHRKHGDIVRLGPNTLSFGNPLALKAIYGLNKGFVKSDFYPVQQALVKGARLPSLFSTTDEQYHANLRKSVNHAFSMSSLVQYEPYVDKTTEKFLDQTDAIFSSRNAICDFVKWLQFYAFDVIGEITYSRRHGFVDRYEDIDGMVDYLGKLFSYVAPIGQIPILDAVLLKNPILRLLDKCNIMSFTFPVARFAKACVEGRRVDLERLKANGPDLESKSEPHRNDLLSMFLKAKDDRPDFFHDGRVLTMAVSMSFAGSDTTAISLSAVFYYLLKNPQCYRKLMEEIDTAIKVGDIQNRFTGLVTWAESQRLPYLDACIKEAFRLHPAVGLPLERIVPAGGAEILGERVAADTIVGCSAWVIHRRPEVFGEDADSYRPERWIDADKQSLKEMEGSMFHFGMGARTCIGKNISLLEIYKVVPAFLRRFEINLAYPNQEWKLHNAWFVKQRNFFTTFKRRRISGAASLAECY
ncbi:hypothetical protein MMC22_004002 [Lobaria immixta]|nr:hypothetical protein [Lobaria immixta]